MDCGSVYKLKKLIRARGLRKLKPLRHKVFGAISAHETPLVPAHETPLYAHMKHLVCAHETRMWITTFPQAAGVLRYLDLT
jgi:hypothetical protein